MEQVETNGHNGGRVSGGLRFLTGLGAGIALTVLLAPRSGAATRRLIGRKVEKGEDWMKDKAAAAQDYVKGHAEELRDQVKEAAEVLGRH
jgi:gas vesicle protein